MAREAFMDRRVFLAALSAPAFVTILRPFVTFAQDREWVRALEAAQRDRPKALSAKARIAPASEPGDPLVVHGRAVAEDGTSAIAGAVVFAYHTDREGLYNRPGSPAHSWRLRGWAQAAADGGFEFATIRPGGYPGSNIPQHIHLQIFLADGRRYWAEELQFADDPRLPAAERGEACSVRTEGAVQHVDFTLRLNPRNKF
jgi:protocatechuate 3,4-dioxygenase beta subunit